MTTHTLPQLTLRDLQEKEALKVALRERVLRLPYPAFMQLAALVVAKMGYENIKPAARKRFRGHNSNGGFDLKATLPKPSPHTVLVQAKQFAPQKRVYQRTVDELRGACLRVGASEGVLLTTSLISGSVLSGMYRYAPLVPLRLIDGDELLRFLVDERLGVIQRERAEPGRSTKRFVVDEMFFQSLAVGVDGERGRSGSGRVSCGQDAPGR